MINFIKENITKLIHYPGENPKTAIEAIVFLIGLSALTTMLLFVGYISVIN